MWVGGLVWGLGVGKVGGGFGGGVSTVVRALEIDGFREGEWICEEEVGGVFWGLGVRVIEVKFGRRSESRVGYMIYRFAKDWERFRFESIAGVRNDLKDKSASLKNVARSLASSEILMQKTCKDFLEKKTRLIDQKAFVIFQHKSTPTRLQRLFT